MDDQTPASNELADASAALWLLGALIAGFAAFVGLGYARHAARQPRLGARGALLAAAGTALGTGCWAAMLLDIGSLPLAAPPGFRAAVLAASWLLAAASCGTALTLAATLRKPRAVATASLLLAAGVVGAQWLLLAAAGLAPGVAGRLDALTMALPVVLSGCFGALWIAYLGGARSGRRRVAWRVGAAAMLGVAIIAGQELVVSAADIGGPARGGQQPQRQVPATAACLVAGLVVPMLLLAAAVDLRMRRRRQQTPTLSLPGRRRQHVRKRSRLDG